MSSSASTGQFRYLVLWRIDGTCEQQSRVLDEVFSSQAEIRSDVDKVSTEMLAGMAESICKEPGGRGYASGIVRRSEMHAAVLTVEYVKKR